MPYHEWSQDWTFLEAATTGALTAVQVRGCVSQFTFQFVAGAGCTATVQMQAAAESSGPWVSMIQAANLSTSNNQIQQMAGPLDWLRPYCTAKTTGVLYVRGTGN